MDSETIRGGYFLYRVTHALFPLLLQTKLNTTTVYQVKGKSEGHVYAISCYNFA